MLITTTSSEVNTISQWDNSPHKVLLCLINANEGRGTLGNYLFSLTWRQEGHFGVLQVPVSDVEDYIIVRHILHHSRHLFISFFARMSVIIN